MSSLEQRGHGRPEIGAATLSRMILETLSVAYTTEETLLTREWLISKIKTDHPLVKSLDELRWNKVAAIVDEENRHHRNVGKIRVSQLPFLQNEVHICEPCGNLICQNEQFDKVAVEYGFNGPLGKIRFFYHKGPCECEQPGTEPPLSMRHIHVPGNHVTFTRRFLWFPAHGLHDFDGMPKWWPNTNPENPDWSVHKVEVESAATAGCWDPSCTRTSEPVDDDARWRGMNRMVHKATMFISRIIEGHPGYPSQPDRHYYDQGFKNIETSIAELKEAVRRLDLDLETELGRFEDLVEEEVFDGPVGPRAKEWLIKAERLVENYKGAFSWRTSLIASDWSQLQVEQV